MSPLQLDELAYPDVGALLEDGRPTVLLLPLGATEPHGPHAPLATDTVISVRMCELAAAELADDQELHAYVLPVLPYGVTRYAAAFPGAISIREETLHALVLDVCGSLAAQDFRRVVLINNHFEPEQVRTLRRAAEAAEREHGCLVRLLDLTRREHAERLTEEFRLGSCHAGRYETSLVLAAEPALVREERARDLEPNIVPLPTEIAAGKTDFLALGMDEAYCGAPAEATAAEGDETFATLTAMLVETVRAVAREDVG